MKCVQGQHGCQDRRVEWTRMIWSHDKGADHRQMLLSIDRNPKQESNEYPVDDIENGVSRPCHRTAWPKPSLLELWKPWLWLNDHHLS